jgi:hypothetical protein
LTVVKFPDAPATLQQRSCNDLYCTHKLNVVLLTLLQRSSNAPALQRFILLLTLLQRSSNAPATIYIVAISGQTSLRIKHLLALQLARHSLPQPARFGIYCRPPTCSARVGIHRRLYLYPPMCVPGGKTWNAFKKRISLFVCLVAAAYYLIAAYYLSFEPFVLPETQDDNYKFYGPPTAFNDIEAVQDYVDALAHADLHLTSPVHLDAALDLNAAHPGAHLIGLADAVAFTSPLQQHLFEHVAALPPAWIPLFINFATADLTLPTGTPWPPIHALAHPLQTETRRIAPVVATSGSGPPDDPPPPPFGSSLQFGNGRKDTRLALCLFLPPRVARCAIAVNASMLATPPLRFRGGTPKRVLTTRLQSPRKGLINVAGKYYFYNHA